jgi:hypothetical protein
MMWFTAAKLPRALRRSSIWALSGNLSTGAAPIAASSGTTLTFERYRSNSSKDDRTHSTSWQFMQQQGHKLNPCNSPLHPAVNAGIQPDGNEEISVQEAYTPQSGCFGCGPANVDGLGLRSFRIENGLEAKLKLSSKYCAFPGIINGGVLSTLMDCHGNWTAAVALMDRSCLPKPPLTLTASMFVSSKLSSAT